MTAAVPWRPERLTRTGLRVHEGLRYLVVEEVVDGICVLLAWPWPHVDRQGRLTWSTDDADPLEIVVPLEQLRDQVYRGRLQRDPRCGDTFAGALATTVPVPATGLVDDLRPLFPDGLYDVSADAHTAAKLAYQGGLADVPPPPAGEPPERAPDRGRAPHLSLAAPRAAAHAAGRR